MGEQRGQPNALLRWWEGRTPLVQALFGLGIQPRVLDGHRRAMRKRQQHALLFAGQGPRLKVVDAKHAKNLAIDFDRDVQQGSNALGIGDAVRDTWIVSGVLHGDGLAAHGDSRGDAFARRVRHLRHGLRTEAACRTWNQPRVVFIPDQDRRHVGLQHVCRNVDERLKDLVQTE